MKSTTRLVIALFLELALLAEGRLNTFAEDLFSKSVGTFQVKPVSTSAPLQVPFIFWGGDMATFYANGGTNTQPGSLYNQLGLNLQLYPGDDFPAQVKDYMEGRTPFLRGTFQMIAMASEVIASDERTRGVMVMQMTWSAGDHMVARGTLGGIGDLKGKTIVLQAGGPHVGFLDDILKTTKLSWDDITVVWAKDITGTDNSPAEMFRKNSRIDACFVVTPDMIGLCGGLKLKGTGAEKSIKDAHVIASTTQMSRSIADVYVCRSDFWEANKDLVTKFVAGYLKACEDVTSMRGKFDAKTISPGDKNKYLALLKTSQDIWGKQSLPTLEEDAHGLLMDASFVGYPGNWKFFKWQGNFVGFDSFNKKSADLVTSRGYAQKRAELMGSPIDFDSRFFDAVKLADKNKPVATRTGGGAESSKLTDERIYGFLVNYEANQDEFAEQQYAEEFKRVIELTAQWGSCAVLIRGHADPTLTLKTLVAAGMEKGILRREGGVYSLKDTNGRWSTLSLEKTDEIAKHIQAGEFEGATAGSPLEIVTAAKSLSLSRAKNLKDAIIKYAKDRGYVLNEAQLRVEGVGIAEPVVPKPRNDDDARKNRRVGFDLRGIESETTDFSF